MPATPTARRSGWSASSAGREGDIFVVDLGGGSIRRLRYGAATTIAASSTRGASPLPVTFSATGSTAPPGETITGYDWDFDGDGTTDEHTSEPSAAHTYGSKGLYRARVSVEYSNGDRDASDELPIAVDPPKAVQITAPADPGVLRWSVGDQIALSGEASVGDSGSAVPDALLEWSVVVRHCGDDGDCHSHQADSQLSGFGPGNTGPSGSLSGPDHEYPSHVELRLTARDPDVAALSTSATMRLDPATVNVVADSEPGGRTLTVNSKTAAAPVAREVIRGSLTTVGAALFESDGSRSFQFESWSDGGDAVHAITPAGDETLTARYAVSSAGPPPAAPTPAVAPAPASPAATPAPPGEAGTARAPRPARSRQPPLGGADQDSLPRTAALHGSGHDHDRAAPRPQDATHRSSQAVASSSRANGGRPPAPVAGAASDGRSAALARRPLASHGPACGTIDAHHSYALHSAGSAARAPLRAPGGLRCAARARARPTRCGGSPRGGRRRSSSQRSKRSPSMSGGA